MSRLHKGDRVLGVAGPHKGTSFTVESAAGDEWVTGYDSDGTVQARQVDVELVSSSPSIHDPDQAKRCLERVGFTHISPVPCPCPGCGGALQTEQLTSDRSTMIVACLRCGCAHSVRSGMAVSK